MKAPAFTPVCSDGLAVFTPSHSGKSTVQKMARAFLFIKKGVAVVRDQVRISGPGINRVWTLNLPAGPTVVEDHLSVTAEANQLALQRLAPAGLKAQVIAWPQVNADVLPAARFARGRDRHQRRHQRRHHCVLARARHPPRVEQRNAIRCRGSNWSLDQADDWQCDGGGAL